MKLDKLFAKRDALSAEQGKIILRVDDEISALLYAKWDDWTLLKTELARLECAEGVDYQWGECGDIEMWMSSRAVAELDERERPYFSDYLMDRHNVRADFSTDTLSVGIGDDNIVINRGYGRDNGHVYQGRERIIDRDDYYKDDGRDEARLARLIEAHMEKTGCFPGIYTADDHGNIFPFKQQEHLKTEVPADEEESE